MVTRPGAVDLPAPGLESVATSEVFFLVGEISSMQVLAKQRAAVDHLLDVQKHWTFSGVLLCREGQRRRYRHSEPLGDSAGVT